jgi:ribosomal protein S27AE
MTDVVQKKVICSSCGKVYPGLLYLSLGNMATEEERQKMDSGEINISICPKCGNKNEITDNLPQWTIKDEKPIA